MTADPAHPFGRRAAFALHPAALRPGDPAPAPAFALRPRPAAAAETAAAPPWVAPYRHQAWALPRVDQQLRLAPPAMPLRRPRAPGPVPVIEAPMPATGPAPRDEASAPLPATPRIHPGRIPIPIRRWKPWAAIGLGPLAAGAAAVALLLLRPPAPISATALFPVPRPTLQATADGRAAPVPAKSSAAVPPDPAPAESPALHRLHAQLDALRARAGLIDAALAQRLPGTAVRAQALQRLRQSTAAEIEQIQSLAGPPPPFPLPEAPVQTALRGTVLSMNTPPGANAR